MTRAYYNENDPKAAAWLRELIKENLIAPGDVDERSILDVKPHELTSYVQQHFFAGIGGWSFALRLAGWPDGKPVRTGSCPCQPFSQAGQRKGTSDERHLWPVFRNLITFGEATITFGEQVASPLGREWLAGIRTDLEGLGYEVGAADLCAAGVGAPNIRQRLFWVAHTKRHAGVARRIADKRGKSTGTNGAGTLPESGRSGMLGGLANAGLPESQRRNGNARGGEGSARNEPASHGSDCWLEHSHGTGSQGRIIRGNGSGERPVSSASVGFWSAYELIPCADGKSRRIEPGSFPLAHGVPHRVGLLRGYGNAINPYLAATFIQASEEAIAEIT